MILFILMTCILIPVHSLCAQDARIKIDVDRTIGEINPMLYGNFVEHLGRCVYGGIYDENSTRTDARGFRTDILKAVKALNIPILRYPGGNFVSGYHWLDGVGPKDQRPPRMELAWQRLESNRFGTGEFIEYCREIGTEPYFAVNLGTGSFDEAREWIEYCNVKEGPYYAELRKKHGYPEPHNVRYWSLGNEMDGPWQMGHKNREDYSKFALEAAKLMLRTSPGIHLVAAGSSNYREGADPNGWNRYVLQELKDVVDYIALHIYVGNVENNYYNFLAAPLEVERRTQIVKGMIAEVMETARRGNRPPIYIAWDEYNVWYRARGGKANQGVNALEEHYNLEDALAVAIFLNTFVRNADVVKMANMAQLVNVIAPLFTNENDMFRQTIYYPLQLFAANTHGTSLDVQVICDTYNTSRFPLGLGEVTSQMNDVPYLDVSVAYQDGEVVINVVNRHKTDALTTDIICQEGQFAGEFMVREVNGSDIKLENDFGKEPVITRSKESVHANGANITYSFPPHSFTQFKGRIER